MTVDYQIIAVSRKKKDLILKTRYQLLWVRQLSSGKELLWKWKVLTFLGILDLFFWPGKLRHLTYGSEVYINKIKTWNFEKFTRDLNKSTSKKYQLQDHSVSSESIKELGCLRVGLKGCFLNQMSKFLIL